MGDRVGSHTSMLGDSCRTAAIVSYPGMEKRTNVETFLMSFNLILIPSSMDSSKLNYLRIKYVMHIFIHKIYLQKKNIYIYIFIYLYKKAKDLETTTKCNT